MSAADVKKLDRIINALEHWNDVRIAQAVRDIDQTFVAFIDEIRALIKKKQQGGAREPRPRRSATGTRC